MDLRRSPPRTHWLLGVGGTALRLPVGISGRSALAGGGGSFGGRAAAKQEDGLRKCFDYIPLK